MPKQMRLVLILFLAIVCFSPPVWMLFHPSSAAGLGKSLLLASIFLVLCVAPVYPLYLQLRRRPQSAPPMLLLIGALACAMAYGIVEFVLHLDTPFADWVADLGTVLIIASCLLFIWQAVRERRNGPEQP